MLNWLKRTLLNRIYRSTIKDFSLPKKRRSPKGIKNISVILDYRLGIDKEHFQKIGKYFNVPRRNIRVLTFFQSKKQIDESNSAISYTSKNISNFGVLNDVLSCFCSRSSDILINFYDKDDIFLKYLSAKTNKRFSIGFNSVDNELNDLIIEVDSQDIDVFVDECIKYLKIFFTNNK
tara:strand:+ start:3253 stop:3783 length:531 start_codon:yes stop_codon:yes gene_type:complete